MVVAKYLFLVASTAFRAYGSPMLDVRQSVSLPTGWVSFGCFSDIPSARTLRIAAFTDVTNMTIESCITFCTPAGYNFAGVEFSRECYCDNVIESPAVPIDNSNCVMPCTGNANEICGGSNAISVLQHVATSSIPSTPTSTSTTTSTPTPTPTPTPTSPTIKQTVGTFQYKGCFQDRPANQPRVLGTQLTISGVTAESCTSACKAAGFALAGLEFGQECWCATYMSLVSPLPDSQCNMVCNADSTEICGSGNILAVYQDTSATPLNPTQCLSNAILFPGAGGVPDFNFNLQMVPSSGVGSPILLGAIFSGMTIPVNQQLFELSGNLAQTATGHFFRLSGGAIGAPGGFSLTPAPGGVVLFDFVSGFSTTMCAVPNAVGAFGPFIGPPVLSVSGHADLWAVCTDPLTPIFSPNATNGVCSSVLLEMVPPVFN